MKPPPGYEDEASSGGATAGSSSVDVAAGPMLHNDLDCTDSIKLDTKDMVVPLNGPKLVANSIQEANQMGSSTEDKGQSSSTESSTSEPSTSETEEFHTAVKC